MKKVMNHYLKLVRFPNLLIVALTQFLIYYCFLLPAFEKVNIAPALDAIHFLWFVIDTMLIAAIGYVANDIIDYPIDLINKKRETIIYRHIRVRTAKYFIGGMIGFGMAIALQVAMYVDNIKLAGLFPLAVGLLIWYAYYFKRVAIIGNAIVSAFCAFVAGIVWFAERHTFSTMMEQDESLALTTMGILTAYMAFAFVANFYREIIKDIEDQEGDRKYGCRTLPIIAGEKIAKLVAMGFLGWLLSMVVLFGNFLYAAGWYISFGFSMLIILIPTLYNIFLLAKAKTKQDYHQLSTYAKYIMVAGLLLIVLLGWEVY